jgi:hypothetical protein
MPLGRRTRCDDPNSPFKVYKPLSQTTTTTSEPSVQYIYIPPTDTICPVSEDVDGILTCLCGTMLFPRGSESNASLGSSININNTLDVDLRHSEDVLVKDEQIFKTVSTTVSNGSDIFPDYIRIKFADHYKKKENKITVNGSIKILIKTPEDGVIAVNYINDF